jgi:formylglycine-generating enzyme required for sulfatase activity/predicted Ser/Thr protein kinase
MTTLGKYEILEEIGRGGFAVVYKARDTSLDRVVALKVLDLYWAKDPSFVTRFGQEARGAARLRHPNIITVYEAGEAEGQLFIAMEYVPGLTLRELLEREGALPLERASSILEQVADALDYAHQQGVIHRDVKPANIMVEDTEHGQRATLMDFGLVKAMAGSTALTSLGTLLGSPEFMAPEQADPERAAEVGPAADRYALGIVAYQMLTGRVPFIGNTPATLNAHEHKPVPQPRSLRPDLPKPAAAALLKMLAKAPGDRYPTATAFVAALRRDLRSEKEPRQPLPVWAWATGAGLVAVALIVFVLVLNGGGDENGKPTDTPTTAAAVIPPSTDIPQLTATPEPTDTAARPTDTPEAVVSPTPQPTDAPTAADTATPRPTDTPTPSEVPALGIGSTTTRERDGAVMVYVPGGTFQMGSTEGADDEQPVHSVTLDSFWIDQTEVTNAQYRKCVEDGACEEPGCWDDSDLNAPDQPVVCVIWYEAQAYCEWAGGRLPTEAEWEYAARGPQGNKYPWGDDEPTCELAQFSECSGKAASVGSFPDGASWSEALDMAGNVWEWVNDWYGEYPSTDQTNPIGPETGDNKVLRGGSWGNFAGDVRSAYRSRGIPHDSNSSDGFRCVGAATS